MSSQIIFFSDDFCFSQKIVHSYASVTIASLWRLLVSSIIKQ